MERWDTVPGVSPKALRSFTVRARLPEALAPLQEIAMNLRWSWDDRARELFRWVSPEAWEKTSGDPLKVLGSVSRRRFEDLMNDRSFMEFMRDVQLEFRNYLESDRWFQHRNTPLRSVAYFSPEFGLTETLPQYSGGLGVLAGDHLKAASGLGIPILGVGLFYREGYFRQELNADGQQQERYLQLDPYGMALTRMSEDVEVSLAGTPLRAQIWKACVGRVALYLLDSDVEGNDPSARLVTDRLYGGDEDHRIAQEILLGVGGVRALDAVGEDPQVFHMNEGHAGFLSLERIRRFITDDGLTFAEAVEANRAATGFTTHTPVAAGIDRFPRPLMERYFKSWADECGITFDQFMAIGQEPGADPSSHFNMAVMSLRLASKANSVSRLHGHVSRQIFHSLWPDIPVDEVPIDHVTNGVHPRSWVSSSMAKLFDRYVMPDWEQANGDRWSQIMSARDDEVWRVKETAREQLVLKARRLLKAGLLQSGAGGVDVDWADRVLDSRILTIGFARRFAEYKRATLLFQYPERLKALLLNTEQPIQIVLAGKSHPKDEIGKGIIREIVQFARDPLVRHRVVFIPDYDMRIARMLYQGSDVWLNNPRRPLEACGTSGEKAALNGALNLSIRDGWWDEMFNGENGWAISSAETYGDTRRRDELEAASLFEILERQVIPKFYDRRDGPVPGDWVRMVKSSLATLGPKVSAARMLRDYLDVMYEPLAENVEALYADHFRLARQMAQWRSRVVDGWGAVKVSDVEEVGEKSANRGDTRTVRAVVELGNLRPEDVALQLLHGPVGPGDELQDTQIAQMDLQGADGGGYRYEGQFGCEMAGRYGYAVRVVPSHEHLNSFTELGLITWAT
ncbi:MAG TPA: alpha-glucan family phosphorylase [Actinomycetota bacterium]|nr:alpha-glucan family phosphorylase [Actinomycetota bacterium]